MPVSFVDDWNNDGGSDNPTAGTWNLPAGWQEGDVGIFWWYSRHYTKTFTEPGTVTEELSSAPVGYGHLWVGTRVLETGDTTFDWTASSVADSPVVFGVVVFRNVAAADPIEASSAVVQTTNNDTCDPAAVTTVTPGAAVVVIDAYVKDSSPDSYPANYTQCGGDSSSFGSDCSAWLIYRVMGDPGTENPPEWQSSHVDALSDLDHQTWTFALAFDAEERLSFDGVTVR